MGRLAKQALTMDIAEPIEIASPEDPTQQADRKEEAPLADRTGLSEVCRFLSRENLRGFSVLVQVLVAKGVAETVASPPKSFERLPARSKRSNGPVSAHILPKKPAVGSPPRRPGMPRT